MGILSGALLIGMIGVVKKWWTKDTNLDIKPVLSLWRLRNICQFDHIALPNNYVVKAWSDEYQADVVLKIGPKHIIDQELQALNYFKGDSCVAVLKSDATLFHDRTALLLACIKPGTSLKDLYLDGQEDAALNVFVETIQKLHTAPMTEQEQQQYAFIPTIAQKLTSLDTFQSNNQRLMNLVSQAQVLKNQLLATQEVPYFLHGDLHHENILRHHDDWVMIDPQGLIGELSYEVGAFMRNPMFVLLDDSHLIQVLENRFEFISRGLQLDKQRIIEWSFVQAVLAASYCHDQKACDYFIAVAESLTMFLENF